MNNKKAISPVIAVSLLIVVSVVAVIGYQTWYQGYQSVLYSDTEQKSKASGGGITIEYISSDGIMYVLNKESENVTLTSIDVGGVDCSINEEIEPGITNISIVSCLNQSGTNDIVIITDSGIYEKKIFVENPIDSSQGSGPSIDCSVLSGGDWIFVAGDSNFGTSDFCVMKYEAKDDGTTNCAGTSCPISQTSGNPWASINQVNAKTECESLGVGYHLITEAQWMTIARLIEFDQTNWADETIGSATPTGGIYRGNVGLNDVISCNHNSAISADIDGTNCLISGGIHDGRNKRTLNVGSEVIWDFSGNVWEFTNDTCTGGDPVWYQFATALTAEWDMLAPANLADERVLASSYGDYTSVNGIGRFDGCTNNGNIFTRGGGNFYQAACGIYALHLGFTPAISNALIGFRCAYTP